jgi:uncharacterized membrane protein YhaH (DUF805 family)
MAGLTGAGLLAGVIPAVGLFLSLGLLVPAVALTAKRLHYCDRAASLVLVSLVPALFSPALAMLASS